MHEARRRENDIEQGSRGHHLLLDRLHADGSFEASIGDYRSRDRDEGGLALSMVTTSTFFLDTILVLVFYLVAVTRSDQIEITNTSSTTACPVNVAGSYGYRRL